MRDALLDLPAESDVFTICEPDRPVSFQWMLARR